MKPKPPPLTEALDRLRRQEIAAAHAICVERGKCSLRVSCRCGLVLLHASHCNQGGIDYLTNKGREAHAEHVRSLYDADEKAAKVKA